MEEPEMVKFYQNEENKAIFVSLNGEEACSGAKELIANTTDAAKEKHVPVVTRKNGVLHIQVGSALHPMLAEHHIAWIAVESAGRLVFKYLQPGEEPVVEVCDSPSGTVYEYCNLHGLWKKEL